MKTEDLIVERLQRLLCLSLESQPAADLITGTARIWTEHLAHIDPARLAAAFNAVEKNSKRWPTIAYIRECIPAYALPHRIATEQRIEQGRDPKEDAAAQERIRQLLQETQRRLGEKVEQDGEAP